MKSDSQIKNDVLDELTWETSVDETEIGVIVENGIVTLSGTVDNYAKKIAAEKAAKRVDGVKAVAEDIKVVYGDSYKKTDKEIAKAVVNALEWNASVPHNKIMVKVEDGYVYLSGVVKWEYQKSAAKRAVENLLGVKYVSNNITLKQTVKAGDIKDKITKAFERSAELEAKNIRVEVDGHTVTLKGTVHSFAEKDEARRAAYQAPGVYKLINDLKVEYYSMYD